MHSRVAVYVDEPTIDLARLGQRLESLRGVHDVAHHRGVAAGAHRADEHLAGVHADAHPDRDADLLGDERERLLHPQRGTDRPFGVVLVGDRRAEQRDDLVADDLVEATAEGRDVGHEPFEAAVDEALRPAPGRRVSE